MDCTQISYFQYESIDVADLNGDGRDDLVLVGRNQFAVLYAGRTDPALSEIASYETKLKDTYFADVVGRVRRGLPSQ